MDKTPIQLQCFDGQTAEGGQDLDAVGLPEAVGALTQRQVMNPMPNWAWNWFNPLGSDHGKKEGKSRRKSVEIH